MSVVNTIINWEFLPHLLAVIALGSAAMAFWRFTENGTTGARRRARRRRREETRKNQALQRQRDRADEIINRARSAYERSQEDRNTRP
jgi:hypothetical protein